MKGPILVIGATGNQGGHVARALLDAGWAVHAFTRNPASPKAQILKDKGAILVQGNLSDLNSLKAAIRNVTGIFSVQNFWDLGLREEVRLGSNVIEAAKEVGNNPHIVYSSGLGAERRQNVAAIDGKAMLEEKVRQSGLPFAILRPGLFMDDFRGASLPFPRPIQRVLRNHRPLVGRLFLATLRAVARNSPIPLTTLNDVGRMAAWVFENPGNYQRRAYHVVGSLETGDTLCILWEQTRNQSIPHIPALTFGLRVAHPQMAVLLTWLPQHRFTISDQPLTLKTYREWLSVTAR
ncbi:NmrA/HSCARG family protein [Sulfobacillus harzensis]|uniref:NmrA/HSCARG family protein n=1 Tax=Sulfobacillus harzensis TaxID=2729629 RepID=A0A7Y0L552_9FIRM|nr:NmrA/HSCARG family protein [Sulfobacillus harzensis]NMP23502.1 NmrA/HSCARG family protein [Sulfobacillus harzensis]